MKRSTLFAGVLGLGLVGTGIYVATRSTTTTSAPSSQRTTAEPTATERMRPSLPTPGHAPRKAPGEDGTSTSTRAPSGEPTPSGVQADGTSPNKDERGSAAASAEARVGSASRKGQDKLREPQVTADETPEQRQLRIKRTVEKAACEAPDIGARLAQLPAAEGKRLQERCAALGITVEPAQR